MWQRRYLVALASTGNPSRARAIARVSPETVAKYLACDPAYSRAHDAIVAGQAVIGLEDVRRGAIAHAGAIIEEAVEASRAPEHKERDHVANRRLVLEAAGVVGGGQPQQGGPKGAPQGLAYLVQLQVERMMVVNVTTPVPPVVAPPSPPEGEKGPG